MNKLKKYANKNIEFLGHLGDKEMSQYYSKCKAFIFPPEEDFGITPLEAMASGRPVIAFKGGGALETVVEISSAPFAKGGTGMFFAEQTPQSIIEVVKNFNSDRFNSEEIREYALGFDKEIFKKKIREFIEKECEKNIKY